MAGQLCLLLHWIDWRRKWQPTPVLLPGKSHGRRSLVGYSPWGCKESDTTEWLHFHFGTSWVAQMVKRLLTMQETQVRSLGREDPLEKEVAAHSSTLAWKIPWTEESGRLQSMGSQRVGHDWATSLSLSLDRPAWEGSNLGILINFQISVNLSCQIKNWCLEILLFQQISQISWEDLSPSAPPSSSLSPLLFFYHQKMIYISYPTIWLPI